MCDRETRTGSLMDGSWIAVGSPVSEGGGVRRWQSFESSQRPTARRQRTHLGAQRADRAAREGTIVREPRLHQASRLSVTATRLAALPMNGECVSTLTGGGSTRTGGGSMLTGGGSTLTGGGSMLTGGVHDRRSRGKPRAARRSAVASSARVRGHLHLGINRRVGRRTRT